MRIAELVEGEKFIIQFHLTYGSLWYPKPANHNTPVKRSELSSAPSVFFSIKNRDTDVTPFLEYDDSDADQIQWIDEDNGDVIVILDEDTLGHSKRDCFCELRLKMADGSFTSVKSKDGRMTVDILPSAVGNPSS